MIPKPMVEIGEHPIIWHIMNWYAKFGFNDFILALGYKANVIKEYFLNYYMLSSDFSINLGTGEKKDIGKAICDWNITLIDTGLDTMTGGRIKRLENLVDNETFMLTYGDGLANIDIADLVKQHTISGKIATLSAVHPTARFGDLVIDSEGIVTSFKEKPQLHEGRINGGFFVLEPAVFKYIAGDDTVFEKEPLETLVQKNELHAYLHDGFWQSMDTVRERQILEEMWRSNRAPWK
jgi:glucose-1-phosphate cytidylyltransferase